MVILIGFCKICCGK